MVIGSGVTGVEFVHMFSSLGCDVSLIVSRQQVLPQKDPEVAAVLEADFSRRGVRLLKGARAVGVDQDDRGVVVRCDDGRVVQGSHALLAIGSVPNSEGLGLEEAGVEMAENGTVPINRHCQTNVPHIFAAGDLSGKLPLSSVASMQGRKVAEYVVGGHTASHRHPNYESAPSAIFTEPEIADVGLAEADAFAEGRKIRVTKVPFAASARALIDNDCPGLRQDHHRPGHRHRAGRVDRGPERVGAHLRTGGGGDRRAGRQRHRGVHAGPPHAGRGPGRGGRVAVINSGHLEG